MRTLIYPLVFVALISSAIANNVTRRGRFFMGRYTTTVIQVHKITSVVPSSCVQVEPTLLPCRNVRNMNMFPQIAGYTLKNEYRQREGKSDVYLKFNDEPLIQTTDLGWGEYFGLYPYTVTEIRPSLETTIVKDPNIVVTFSVKGCKPSVLPMNLDRCPPVPSISIEEILPTSTVPFQQNIQSTVYDNGLVQSGVANDENYNGPFVEATENHLANDGSVVETEALQPLK